MAGEMSFWDHLEELRKYLFRVLGALVVVLVGCFVAMPHIFDPLILAPARRYGVQIININVVTPFLMHVSTSFWMALLIVFPYLVFEIWEFVRPALYPREIKGVRMAFAGGTLLFYAGCAVSYFAIFPITFRFLSGYTLSTMVPNTISLNSYMNLFLGLTFAMGVVFEMPILAWLLGVLGILNRQILKGVRRYAVVVLLVAAALITPTGDPFTLMVVFVPLYLLYELSILMVPAKKAEPEEDDQVAPEPQPAPEDEEEEFEEG